MGDKVHLQESQSFTMLRGLQEVQLQAMPCTHLPQTLNLLSHLEQEAQLLFLLP